MATPHLTDPAGDPDGRVLPVPARGDDSPHAAAMPPRLSSGVADAQRLPGADDWSWFGRRGLALWAVLLLGVFLRVREWGANRGLWVDEAGLANNLVERGFADLFQPLIQNQTAPIGFLLSCELSTRVFGMTERALRLVPLLSGCAGLLVFAALAREVLRTWFATVVTALAAATSLWLVYYSNEFKPYSCDFAAAALLGLLAQRAMRTARPRDVAWLGAACCLVQPLSSASVLVIAGILPPVALRLLLRRRFALSAAICGIAVLALAVFAAHFHFVLRHAQTDRMFVHWTDSFPPSPRTWSGLTWLAGRLPPIVAEVSGIGPWALALVVAGGIWLRHGRRWELLVVLGPLAATYAVALAGQYPLSPRVVMHLAPSVLLMAGATAGYAGVVTRQSSWRRLAAAAVLAGVVTAAPLAVSLGRAVRPRPREELRDLLALLASRVEAGDVVWFHTAGTKTYQFYASTRPDLSLRQAEQIVLDGSDQFTTEAVVEAVEPLAQRGRVWVVYSHLSGGRLAIPDKVDDALQGRVRQLEKLKTPGAWARAYGPPTSPAIPTITTAPAAPE